MRTGTLPVCRECWLSRSSSGPAASAATPIASANSGSFMVTSGSVSHVERGVNAALVAESGNANLGVAAGRRRRTGDGDSANDDDAGEGLSDHARAVDGGADHRHVLGAEARDQPDGDDPAHHAAERADGAGRQLPQGGEEEDRRVSGAALQRHRRLQGDRGGVVVARDSSGSGARQEARRAHRHRRARRRSPTAISTRRARSIPRTPRPAPDPSAGRGCTRATSSTTRAT